MKLEKVVSKPRKGLWISLFIAGLAIAGAMATSYNFEIVQNVNIDNIPWTKIVLGTLGFISIICALLLFLLFYKSRIPLLTSYSYLFFKVFLLRRRRLSFQVR